MTYTVMYTKKSLEALERTPKEEAERVLRKIVSIRGNPIPHLKKLKGSRLWRLRSGKRRAIIDVIVKGKRLIVLRIGRRESVY